MENIEDFKTVATVIDREWSLMSLYKVQGSRNGGVD